MVTEQEILFILDRVLGSVEDSYVSKNILNYEECGHKTPIEGARFAVGIGGFGGPKTPAGHWDNKGIRVTSADGESEVLVPYSRLVDRAYELAGLGQQKLF
jgi:hypothetical protein